MPRDRLRACAGVLAVVVAVTTPVLVAGGPPPSGPVTVGAAAEAPRVAGPVAPAGLAGALSGVETVDVVTRPPGSVAVSRAGEDGLALSWALLDTTTGEWTGSADAAERRTEAESTIKAWLAADTLRAAAEAGRPVTTAERADITAAVRASDDDAAERLYRRLGRDASTARLDDECGVEVSTSRRGWWSFTQLTAVDAARILACVRDRAPEWPGGDELLADLASITPDGRSGIGTTLPGTVAEKNGWTLHGAGTWNVNCVLAWEDRALAVLLSYPGERGVEHGWAACRDVADDVLAVAAG